MKTILTFDTWLAENAQARPIKSLSDLHINRKFEKDQFTGDKYETELFPMFRRLKPRIEALSKKPNLEEWFIMMQNSDNQFYSMVQADVLGQPDVRELWRDLTGRRASKMHKYNLAESAINEWGENLNSAIPWKKIGGKHNQYRFDLEGKVYQVRFVDMGDGIFERVYNAIPENKEVKVFQKTGQGKPITVNATVMQITNDFLNTNRNWSILIIKPMSETRYDIVTRFLENTLPDQYRYDANPDDLTIVITKSILNEAVYHGRKVKLGKPFLTPNGPKKRAVYVKNAKGNVVKVNFGDPNMRIKAYIPARRKSYRARHHCQTPGPKWKANYWSCKAW